jgi:hypothetical protein
VKVFHQPPFVPPLATLAASLLVIVTLVGLALGPLRRSTARADATILPASPLAATLGVIWSFAWYGIQVLAFGIAPQIPPAIPTLIALAIAGSMLLVLPRWTSARRWTTRQSFWLCAGSVLGLMAVSFIGFLGPPNADLYFKIVIDAIAAAGIVLLWRKQQSGWDSGLDP